MTTTSDADIRAALESATGTNELSLDPSAVLELGKRVVRRRRLGGAAAVAAVLAVAVGVAAFQPDRPRAIPATPSDRTTTTLDIQGEGASVKDIRKVQVSYDAARRIGTFVIDHHTAPQTRAEVVLDPKIGGGLTVTGVGTDHAVLFLLLPSDRIAQPWPAPVAQADLWTAGGLITGANLVAQVRNLAPGDPGPRTIYREDDTKGAVFGDGSRVESARVPLGAADLVLWIDRSGEVFGSNEYVDRKLASASNSNLVEPVGADFFHLDGSRSYDDPSGMTVWTTTAAGLLPAGATLVRPEFRHLRPKGLEFGSAVMSGEGLVALGVRCTSKGDQRLSSAEMCKELKGVSWMDRAGKKRFTPLL